MPLAIKSNNGKTAVAPKVEEKAIKPCCQQNNGCCGDFGKKIIMTLVGVLLVYGVFYLGTLVHNNIKKYDYIGRADKSERIISIAGYGKATGANDIAVTTIGYTNTDKDVSNAQAANKVVMDAVEKELKVLGIVDKDMQSDYSIYPEYDYTTSGSNFKGYKVTHQITVKIRDLAKVQTVLGLVSKYKINQVNSLSFTIDDTENLKAQARAKALADARRKAQYIAQSLGAKLVSVVSYSEYEGGSNYAYPSGGWGKGGGEAGVSVASGSKDVELNVNINYEIAPLSY